MKNLINKTNRLLTYEEHRAIIDASETLGKAFKKRVFSCTVAPNTSDRQQGDVFGLQFAFDLSSDGWK